MDDNEKKDLGSSEEFENREVKNTMPQLNDKEYDLISNRSRSFRSSAMEDDDDNEEEEEDSGGYSLVDNESSDDDDIIGSLLDGALENGDKPKSGKKSIFGGSFNIGKSSELKEKKEPKGKPIKDKRSLFNRKKQDDDEVSQEELDRLLNDEPEEADEPAPEEMDSGAYTDGDNVEKDNIKINSIGDIEHKIKVQKARQKGAKITRTLIIVGIVVILLCAVGLGVLKFLSSDTFKNMTSNEEEPPATIEPEPEDNNLVSGFISQNSSEDSYNQGTIKRILGNKILISPDNEDENVIYYIDSNEVISGHKSGEHIEYKYVVRDYLPYITEVVMITEGVVAYKGIMTLNLLVNDVLEKYIYTAEVEEEIKDLGAGDKIYYIYEMDGENQVITDIVNVLKKGEEKLDESGRPQNTESSQTFNKDDFYEEYKMIDNREASKNGEDSYVAFKSNIEDNKISFYSGIMGPVWIRNAWRATDLMDTVPTVEDVAVTLVTPEGVQINKSNIDDYGRMWIDGQIINFALREGEIGEYQLLYSKPKGTYLGEASIHVMELSGFITIEKFGANLIDRDVLELIWNISGVPDDGLEIEVYLTNDKFSTLIYSGSSKNEELHIIDKRQVSVSNLPRGQYNIIVTVKDIDMKTSADDPNILENTIMVTAETIIETKNVGVLILQ